MKKNLLFGILTILICLSLTGCNLFFNKDPKQTTTQAQTETTTELPQFEIIISYNELSDSIYAEDGTNLINYTASFPELNIIGGNSSAEQNMNDYFSGLDFNFVHTIQPTISEATEYYQDNSADPNFFWNPYEIEETFEMTRGDEVCISFKQTDYSYLGGAHPGSMLSAFNFDSNTGNILDFSDVVSNEANAYTFVTNYILDLMSEPTYDGMFFDDYADTVTNIDLTDRWYFSDQGFVVIFNEYEVGPYAVGHFEFTIPYIDFTFLLDEYK